MRELEARHMDELRQFRAESAAEKTALDAQCAEQAAALAAFHAGKPVGRGWASAAAPAPG